MEHFHNTQTENEEMDKKLLYGRVFHWAWRLFLSGFLAFTTDWHGLASTASGVGQGSSRRGVVMV